MRVAYIIDTQDVEDIEGIVAKLIVDMKQSGSDVFVIALRSIRTITQRLGSLDISIRTLDLPEHVKLLPTILKVQRMLRDIRPDILHTYQGEATIIGRFAGRLARVPVVVHTLHSLYVAGRLHNWLLAKTTKFHSLTTTGSKTLAREVIENGWSKPLKIDTVHNGVELDSVESLRNTDMDALQRDLDLTPNKPVFLTVSTIDSGNGCIDAIEAARIMKNVGIEFHWLMANLPAKVCTSLQNLVKKYRLEKYLRFIPTGEYSSLASARLSDRWPLYAISDIFILPSINPSLPVTVLEAMVSKLPVVATSASGAVEVIDHGTNGFLARPKDPEDLAAAIAAIATMRPQDYLQMGRNNYKKAVQDYSAESAVAEMRTIYNESCSGSLVRSNLRFFYR